MALQSSGQISLSDVNVELGNSSTATISMNSSDVRDLFERSSGSVGMNHGYGKSNIPVQAYAWTSSTSWTVPKTAAYEIYAVGGGGVGGREQWNGNSMRNPGGGSGYLASNSSFNLTQGDNMTISIGGSQGTTTLSRNGSSVISASGGNRGGTYNGGSGGSGGGGASGNGFSAGTSGYDGSNGGNGHSGSQGGSGSIGGSPGSGSNPLIPPGGRAGYGGTAEYYSGIHGQGAGQGSPSNGTGAARGCGGGGCTWAQRSDKPGQSGLIVIYG